MLSVLRSIYELKLVYTIYIKERYMKSRNIKKICFIVILQ